MKTARVYKAGIHYGEESLVAGNDRAGMVNFSGCHLACAHCYTPETSVHRLGDDYDASAFAALLGKLRACGAKNWNFISPTHQWTAIEAPLAEAIADREHAIPVVLKVSGYEGRGLVRRMSRLADVFVPDFKVRSRDAARRSHLPETYGEVALAALEEMGRTHGEERTRADGRVTRGIVVRHLLMPGYEAEADAVLDGLAEIHFRGTVNILTRFVDGPAHALRRAPAPLVARLAERAKKQHVRVLVDGELHGNG